MDEVRLPLFPLRVVLFPGSYLPLHIFEERYKVMIKECLADDLEFGINLTEEQVVAHVGCTAKVHDVRRVYEDGRLDIVVQGDRRFLLKAVEKGSFPYLTGICVYLDDVQETRDDSLAETTAAMYRELLSVVYPDRSDLPPVDPSDENMSFLVAQKAGMDLAQRQRLLELSSENDRLRLLHSYLSDVLPKIHEMEEIQRITRSDGFITP